MVGGAVESRTIDYCVGGDVSGSVVVGDTGGNIVGDIGGAVVESIDVGVANLPWENIGQNSRSRARGCYVVSDRGRLCACELAGCPACPLYGDKGRPPRMLWPTRRGRALVQFFSFLIFVSC